MALIITVIIYGMTATNLHDVNFVNLLSIVSTAVDPPIFDSVGQDMVFALKSCSSVCAGETVVVDLYKQDVLILSSICTSVDQCTALQH